MRPPLTSGAIAGAMAATAELLGPELRGGENLAGSLRLRAHAVEAILMVHPEVGADAAVSLAGLSGPDAALRAAAVMSGIGWETRLVDGLVRLLRMLDALPASSAAEAPVGQLDISPVLMGDPIPARSALGRRVLESAHVP